jgi:hypothetical protein
MLSIRLGLLIAASMAFGTGCLATAADSTVASGPVGKDGASEALARDAELTGNEHHISVLEGAISFKIHALETPKVETKSATNGTLYSTIAAKVGPEQTIYCSAYAGQHWPGGTIAADLRGEHDWAEDGSEKSDADAKTTPTLTRFEVASVQNHATISARATVSNESDAVVADRKIILTSTPSFMFLCSDRTIGFDKRFSAFTKEALDSIVVDPKPEIVPTKVSLYRIEDKSRVIGYREVRSYLDDKTGITTTYSDETAVVGALGVFIGADSLQSSVTNAKGEETEINVQSVMNAKMEIENVHAKRDAKGWTIEGAGGGLAGTHYNGKSPLVAFHGPAMMNRLQALAAKKSKDAKFSLIGGDAKSGVVSVIATRTGEGEVGFKVDKQSYSVSFDQDGMKSFDDGKLQYQRIRYEGGDAQPTRLRTRKANKK